MVMLLENKGRWVPSFSPQILELTWCASEGDSPCLAPEVTPLETTADSHVFFNATWNKSDGMRCDFVCLSVNWFLRHPASQAIKHNQS